jgi:dihydrofolate reductase
MKWGSGLAFWVLLGNAKSTSPSGRNETVANEPPSEIKPFAALRANGEVAPQYNPTMTSILRPRLALIAAVAANGVIGRDGTMPWHLSADLKHFKALTTGKRIVMGRRTWQAFPRPLPNREHVVVSSSELTLPAGVIQVPSLAAALALPAHAESPVFVIGGNAMYREALPLTDDLYLTEIAQNVDGDTVFPEWDRTQFREASRETHAAPLINGGPDVTFSFVHYVRR